MINPEITDKLLYINKILKCAVMYYENAVIMKNGTLEVRYTVNIYADVRNLGFNAPILVSDNNINNVHDVLDKLIETLKEDKING